MSRVVLGRLTFDFSLIRSLATLAAGIALGGGLALGIASASALMPNDASEAPPAPQTTPATPPPTGASGPQTPSGAPSAAPVGPSLPRPLHQLLLARLRGAPPAAAGRIVAGRLVEFVGSTATIQTVSNQTWVIHVTPQTKLPARRPRPGDTVLVIGQPARDGALTARAIAVRRQPAQPAPAPARRP